MASLLLAAGPAAPGPAAPLASGAAPSSTAASHLAMLERRRAALLQRAYSAQALQAPPPPPQRAEPPWSAPQALRTTLSRGAPPAGAALLGALAGGSSDGGSASGWPGEGARHARTRSAGYAVHDVGGVSCSVSSSWPGGAAPALVQVAAAPWPGDAVFVRPLTAQLLPLAAASHVLRMAARGGAGVGGAVGAAGASADYAAAASPLDARPSSAIMTTRCYTALPPPPSQASERPATALPSEPPVMYRLGGAGGWWAGAAGLPHAGATAAALAPPHGVTALQGGSAWPPTAARGGASSFAGMEGVGFLAPMQVEYLAPLLTAAPAPSRSGGGAQQSPLRWHAAGGGGGAAAGGGDAYPPRGPAARSGAERPASGSTTSSASGQHAFAGVSPTVDGGGGGGGAFSTTRRPPPPGHDPQAAAAAAQQQWQRSVRDLDEAEHGAGVAPWERQQALLGAPARGASDTVGGGIIARRAAPDRGDHASTTHRASSSSRSCAADEDGAAGTLKAQVAGHDSVAEAGRVDSRSSLNSPTAGGASLRRASYAARSAASVVRAGAAGALCDTGAASSSLSPPPCAPIPPPLSFVPGSTVGDVRRWVMTPAPVGYGPVQCTIIRDRTSSLGHRLHPVYSLFTRKQPGCGVATSATGVGKSSATSRLGGGQAEPGTFLVSARKRPHNKTSNYVMSLDASDVNRDSPAFLGAWRAGGGWVCERVGVRRRAAWHCSSGPRREREHHMCMPTTPPRSSVPTDHPTPTHCLQASCAPTLWAPSSRSLTRATRQGVVAAPTWRRRRPALPRAPAKAGRAARMPPRRRARPTGVARTPQGRPGPPRGRLELPPLGRRWAS